MISRPDVHINTSASEPPCGLILAAPSDIALVREFRLDIPGAFEQLFQRYRRRLNVLASGYFAPGADRDDLIQEATIGFYKATRDYRNERGSFSSFVDLCVRRQLATFVRMSTRQKQAMLNRSVSLDAPAFQGSPRSLSEMIPGQQYESEVDEEKREFLAQLYSRCSLLEKAALDLYTRGFSYYEMAAELHVHTKAIENALWRVKGKAKRLIAKWDYCEYLRTR